MILFREAHIKDKYGQWLVLSSFYDSLQGSLTYLDKEYYKNFIQRFIFNMRYWYIPSLKVIFKFGGRI